MGGFLAQSTNTFAGSQATSAMINKPPTGPGIGSGMINTMKQGVSANYSKPKELINSASIMIPPQKSYKDAGPMKKLEEAILFKASESDIKA